MIEMQGKSGNNKAPRRRGRKGKAHGDDETTFSKQHDDDNNNHNPSSFKPHRTMLIHLTEETPTWYECGRNTQYRNDTIFSLNRHSNNSHKNKKTNQPHIVAKYRSMADSIYKQEINLFRSSSNSNDKDEQWVENTMKNGTLKDRIAAMSVVVSSHPIHKMYALDMLLNLAGVATGEQTHSSQTNERVSQMAAEALTDIFMSTLLPSNRKLISLDARPLYLYEESGEGKMNKITISPRTLLLWRYEEMLKERYNAFISQYIGRTLAQSGTGSLDTSKVSCLRTACNLLKELPEGEHTLLSLVVNKIGDPSKKVAAAAAHELRRILDAHPNMTTIIAREVQQLAHRPNLSTRALYNCIIFLNQLKLVKEDEDEQNDLESSKKNVKAMNEKTCLPASLINTYFQIFEVAVNNKKKDSVKKSKNKESITKKDLAMKGRLLGALLTGVNRAHPYLPTRDLGMEQHVDSLYKIAHVSPPSACTQALMLLFHLAVGSSEENKQHVGKADIKVITARKDRFYRVLYSKIADPSMFAGRQLTLFFNLVYKSMKYDDNSVRVTAFAKRLLHVSFHQSPSVVCGTLFLLSEVMKNQPLLQSAIFSTDGHSKMFDSTKREPSSAFASVSEKQRKGKDDNVEIPDPVAASLWEIALTTFHYHPTVSKFSSSMHEINYTGDPLRDFGLVPFLDKFAFKNPKSAKKINEKLRRGESIGERRSGLQGNFQAMSSLPVNDPNFWNKGNAVSEQDDFFHKFFTERARRDDIKGIVRGKKQDNVDEADALKAAEGKNVDFDWDTDEEEEDFVNKLAESLMEDNSDDDANLDDEDPDMDDWSDYDASDAEDEGKDINGDLEIDNDAMAQSDEDSIDIEDDENSDSSAGDGEDDVGMPFIDDEPASNDEEEDMMKLSSEKEGKEEKKKMPTFASAEEYEEIIMDALVEREFKCKRSLEENDKPEKNNSENNSKQKRRRRSKASK